MLFFIISLCQNSIKKSKVLVSHWKKKAHWTIENKLNIEYNTIVFYLQIFKLVTILPHSLLLCQKVYVTYIDKYIKSM